MSESGTVNTLSEVDKELLLQRFFITCMDNLLGKYSDEGNDKDIGIDDIHLGPKEMVQLEEIIFERPQASGVTIRGIPRVKASVMECGDAPDDVWKIIWRLEKAVSDLDRNQIKFSKGSLEFKEASRMRKLMRSGIVRSCRLSI